MQNSQVLPQAGIVTFDRAAFDEACLALMQLVLQDGEPDALIGIRTGGLHVAQSMASACQVPVLAFTCRRPSTRFKANWLKKLMTRLPRSWLDRLRMVEHKLLTRQPPRQPEEFTFDAAEIAAFQTWLKAAGPTPALVVVDDAVDSGATLAKVMAEVARLAPPTTWIRSAVITVTTGNPQALPRYTLYSRQLCRFPWSLDA